MNSKYIGIHIFREAIRTLCFGGTFELRWQVNLLCTCFRFLPASYCFLLVVSMVNLENFTNKLPNIYWRFLNISCPNGCRRKQLNTPFLHLIILCNGLWLKWRSCRRGWMRRQGWAWSWSREWGSMSRKKHQCSISCYWYLSFHFCL